MSITRILIAEDEERIVSFLSESLRNEGYRTVAVEDGIDALALARDSSFDILVLDLGLPGIDGNDVLREMRARGETMPVIVLTARDSVADTVAGLESGANDYMTKPFHMAELLARIRLQLRNRNTAAALGLDGAERPASELRAGSVVLDLTARRAVVAGRTIELTPREYDLLEMLVRHAGQVVSRDRLLTSIWGNTTDPDSHVVEVYIRYLRKKLGENVIETIRGEGYRIGRTGPPHAGN